MLDKTRAILKPSIVWADHGQGGTIMNMRQGQMSMLNATGIEIVKACAEGQTLRHIVCMLVQKYGHAEEIILSDVKEFTDSLVERGYLEFSQD